MHAQYQGCAVAPGTDPLSLVGRHILHLFVDEDNKWYEGYILSYSPQTNHHEVAYNEEEQTCLSRHTVVCRAAQEAGAPHQ